MSVAEIKNAVAALPERDQADLAVWLLDSLGESAFANQAEEDGGLAEAARRREELDSGRVNAVPAEQFWANVDRERSQWK
jgi:hypothetical protein